MPLPAGASMAREIVVPGLSLKACISEPFAPNPFPTMRKPATEIFGADADGAEDGAAALAGGFVAAIEVTPNNTVNRASENDRGRSREMIDMTSPPVLWGRS